MANLTTSIVIPAHNEAARLAPGYERLRPTLEQMSLSSTEIIVIDDGSTDDTLHVAYEVYGHLPHTLIVQQSTNLGKGAAVRLGIALARGEFIIVADADMAISPHHFPAIVAALDHNNLVPGSRERGGRIRYDSALRTLAGGLFGHLVHHYTGSNLRDTQCGCKGFQRGPARLLALLSMINGFAYDAEMLYLANQLRLTVRPMSVTWDDVHGSSVRVRRDSLTMVSDLAAIRRTRYQNPVIQLERDVSITAIEAVARQVRVQGLVLARGEGDALLVLARDAALAAVEIARQLNGNVATAGLDELRGRTFEAV